MTIYLITNLINGKKYVGQTIKTLNRRWHSHASKSNHCTVLRNAIQKYGKDNFKIESLYEAVSLEELDKKEQEFISSLNTLSPNGYNMTSGGKRSAYSEESRKKMSEAKKGKFVPWNKGLTKDDDFRVGTQGAKGENNRRFGKPGTMRGKKMSSESCEKISKSKTGKKPNITEKSLEARILVGKINSSPIICDQNGKRYSSFLEAQSDLKLYAGSISKFMSGQLSNVKGYTFKMVQVVEITY